MWRDVSRAFYSQIERLSAFLDASLLPQKHQCSPKSPTALANAVLRRGAHCCAGERNTAFNAELRCKKQGCVHGSSSALRKGVPLCRTHFCFRAHFCFPQRASALCNALPLSAARFCFLKRTLAFWSLGSFKACLRLPGGIL